jgi:hypothetical protein
MHKMSNDIQELISSTKTLKVAYYLTFSERGRPDIGVRHADQNMIVIDGTPWLIAGDVVSDVTGKCITDVHHVQACNPNCMHVNLRAQASICGKLVQIHLGSRRVVAKLESTDEGGILSLA